MAYMTHQIIISLFDFNIKWLNNYNLCGRCRYQMNGSEFISHDILLKCRLQKQKWYLLPERKGGALYPEQDEAVSCTGHPKWKMTSKARVLAAPQWNEVKRCY